MDVNENFDGSKLAQLQAEKDKPAALARRVEAGELRDEGNGTYTVLTGWDAGERIRLSVGADNSAQILADHGLDLMADGRAKLYSRQQVWFGLGQIVPDGLSDPQEVLELIGGELEYTKQPAFYRDMKTGEFKAIPDTFAAVWADPDMNNAAMGTVGNRYTHAQDLSAMEFMFDLTHQKSGGDLVVESAGRMQNNSKFFAGLRLAEDMVIDPQGIADGIRQYLYIVNSHDGTGRLTAMNTPWRIRCKNTERFAIRDAQAVWGVRHTANWSSEDRKRQARTALGLTESYYQNWQAEETELLGLRLTGRGLDKFWDIVEDLDPAGSWKKPEETKGRGVTLYQNRRSELEGLLGKNARELGRNGYAAERAVTEYLDHKITRRTSQSWGGVALDDARRGIALLGNDDDKKARLHEGLLALARS